MANQFLKTKPLGGGLDGLSAPELIAQFVLECRRVGTILPYDDYVLIGEWSAAMPNTDQLLLILADFLPSYFLAAKGKNPRSLKAAHRQILRKISAAFKHLN